MSATVLSIFSNTIQGTKGAILLDIAHRFVSSALFICIGGIIYDVTGPRSIKYLKESVLYISIFTIIFFVFILANIGTPPALIGI